MTNKLNTPTDKELIEKIAKSMGETWDERNAVMLVNYTKEIISLCKSHFEQNWVSVEDESPAIGQMVALIDINRYANNGTANVNNTHVNMCGYLQEFGNMYWNVYGERAIDIKAFTHWHPLPSPPESKCKICEKEDAFRNGFCIYCAREHYL